MPPRPRVAAPPELPADRAVRLRDPAGLAADDRSGYDAIVAAFAHYDAGRDDAARDALAPVGLKSPFLEWRVLLRGLLAYSAGDDARALENWVRLDPVRLPARLAAPVRAALDPVYKAAQSDAVGGKLADQYAKLTADPVVDGLRTLRKQLGLGRGLDGAFKTLTSLVPVLRAACPAAVPGLAQVIYHAVRRHGMPSDLPKYKKAFGPPPDDPGFHRLSALAYEDANQPADVAKHWLAYETWLGKGPAGWPADVADRARAIVLTRVARAAADPGRTEFAKFLAGLPVPIAYLRPDPPDPVPMWRRALELAPDWDQPARELIGYHLQKGQLAEAEAVARGFLERVPAAPPVLEILGRLLLRTGRPVEALAIRKRALAANSLDPSVRWAVAVGHLAAARRLTIDGDLAGAADTLAAGLALNEAVLAGPFDCVAAVLSRKRGDKPAADTALARAVGRPGGRVAAFLFVAVDSTLAKLKPAERTKANKALADALAGPATPAEATRATLALDQYGAEGIDYRGQKAHETKLDALILRAADADAPEADFEALVASCLARDPSKMLPKLTAKLRAKFPANPVFPLAEAEALIAARPETFSRGVVLRLLMTATRLAARSADPRHQAAGERAQSLGNDHYDLDMRNP